MTVSTSTSAVSIPTFAPIAATTVRFMTFGPANLVDDRVPVMGLLRVRRDNNLVTKNPVAAAQIFKMTLETIFDTLFGIKPEYLSKVTVANGARNKGIFGKTVAAYTVTEVQGRLSLHGHMTVWCQMSPKIIQQSIQNKKLVPSIKKIILSHIASSIPLQYHVTALSTQATSPKNRLCEQPRRTFFDAPDPLKNFVGFNSHVHNVVNSTSVHQHSSTCVKGPRGHIECRLSYPTQCTNGKDITICELKLITKDIKSKKNINTQNMISNEIEYEEINFENIKFKNYENNNIINKKPLGLPDNKCIIIELQKEIYSISQINETIYSLQLCKETQQLMSVWDTLDYNISMETKMVIAERNGAVVNYSPNASALLRSNTAPYHLGGNEQAKGTLYYLIKYITKDALAPTTSLSLLSYC